MSSIINALDDILHLGAETGPDEREAALETMVSTAVHDPSFSTLLDIRLPSEGRGSGLRLKTKIIKGHYLSPPEIRAIPLDGVPREYFCLSFINMLFINSAMYPLLLNFCRRQMRHLFG